MYITEKWKEIGDLNNAMFEISGKEIISNNGEMGKVRKVKIQIVCFNLIFNINERTWK